MKPVAKVGVFNKGKASSTAPVKKNDRRTCEFVLQYWLTLCLILASAFKTFIESDFLKGSSSKVPADEPKSSKHTKRLKPFIASCNESSSSTSSPKPFTSPKRKFVINNKTSAVKKILISNRSVSSNQTEPQPDPEQEKSTYESEVWDIELDHSDEVVEDSARSLMVGSIVMDSRPCKWNQGKDSFSKCGLQPADFSEEHRSDEPATSHCDHSSVVKNSDLHQGDEARNSQLRKTNSSVSPSDSASRNCLACERPTELITSRYFNPLPRKYLEISVAENAASEQLSRIALKDLSADQRIVLQQTEETVISTRGDEEFEFKFPQDAVPTLQRGPNSIASLDSLQNHHHQVPSTYFVRSVLSSENDNYVRQATPLGRVGRCALINTLADELNAIGSCSDDSYVHEGPLSEFFYETGLWPILHEDVAEMYFSNSAVYPIEDCFSVDGLQDADKYYCFDAASIENNTIDSDGMDYTISVEDPDFITQYNDGVDLQEWGMNSSNGELKLEEEMHEGSEEYSIEEINDDNELEDMTPVS